MTNDPIVDEIREIRDRLAAKFNYDIEAIGRDIMARQKLSKRKMVSPKKRKSQSV